MAEPVREGEFEASHGAWREHVGTYEQFTHMTFMVTLGVAIVIMCLAVAGLGGAYVTGVLGILAALGVTLFSVRDRNAGWRRFAVLGAVVLLSYLLTGW